MGRRLWQTRGFCRKHGTFMRRSENNYQENCRLWAECSAEQCCAQGMAPINCMRYGAHPFSWNGCGILAMFHVLRFLGQKEPLPDLIWQFECNRMPWFLPGAHFGTNPARLGRVLRAKGIGYSMTRTKAEFLQNAANGEHRCGIVSYWNHRISQHPFCFFGGGMHTVAYQFRDGRYEVYNVGEQDTRPRYMESLGELLEDRRMTVGYWI